MPRLVIKLQIDVLAKVSERDLAPQRGVEAPDLVRPILERTVLGQAALKRDRFIFGAARRFARRGGVAAVAKLDDFSRALERADPRNAGDVNTVPLQAKLEILIRVGLTGNSTTGASSSERTDPSG